MSETPATQIRIGNQSHPSAETATADLELAVAAGLDAFEWDLDAIDGFAIPVAERQRLGRVAADHGIALTVHAPRGATPFGPSGHALLEHALAFARELGARGVVVHPDLHADPADLREAIAPFLRQSARLGIGVWFENLPETPPGTFHRFFEAPVPGHAVGVCFDLGHANLCPETRNDYLRYFDALGPEIPVRHVHLHENHGDGDAHLPLFHGPAGADPGGVTGLLERLEDNGFDGAIILQQWPEPSEKLAEIRDRLRALRAGAAG